MMRKTPTSVLDSRKRTAPQRIHFLKPVENRLVHALKSNQESDRQTEVDHYGFAEPDTL